MGLYENIKTLCDRSNIAVTRLESELGFARGSIGKLRSQKSMKADRLDKIADYFGVSVEYLLTGEHPAEYHFDPETARIAQDILNFFCRFSRIYAVFCGFKNPCFWRKLAEN